MVDYELSVASNSKNHNGNVFKVFNIDDEDIIGVEENEPFELLFRNNTGGRVQVRLSVDGTDVLTGDPASTKPAGKMFVVDQYGSMSLKAWPETLQGGARFVFTTKENSVALNTHGSAAGIGLIAAAVYSEYASNYGISFRYDSSPFTAPRRVGSDFRFKGVTKGVTRGMTLGGSLGGRSYGSSTKGLQDTIPMSALIDTCDSLGVACSNNLAVGAGEQVDQTLVKSAGLIRPVLDEIVQVRYLPWKKLQALLLKRETGASNAFPGDKKQINLSNVPRVKSTAGRNEAHRFL